MASVWVLKSTFRMIVSVAGIVDLNLNNGVQNSNSRSCFARHSFFYYLFIMSTLPKNRIKNGKPRIAGTRVQHRLLPHI